MDQKTKIICLGDSLTYGYGIQPYEPEKAWPTLLEANPSFTCVNRGMPGISVTGDKGYVNSRVYLKSMKMNPDAVILFLGSNDSASDLFDERRFRQGYALLVEELLEHVTRDHLLLVVPTDVRDMTKPVTDFEIVPENLTKIDAIIRETADTFGLSCLDLSALFHDHPEVYAEDEVHPNIYGNRMMAEAIMLRIEDLKW